MITALVSLPVALAVQTSEVPGLRVAALASGPGEAAAGDGRGLLGAGGTGGTDERDEQVVGVGGAERRGVAVADAVVEEGLVDQERSLRHRAG